MNEAFIKAGFVKAKKESKMIYVKLCNKKTYKDKPFCFNFETNVIYNIPDSDIKFAIAFEVDNDEYIRFFINQRSNPYNHSVDSPERSWYPELAPTECTSPYFFDYSKNDILKIDTNDIYYLEVRVLNKED